MTHEIPKVSVCCAYYNRSEYLKETLDSLLSQSHPSFEVIIVNDGSTDPNVRLILNTYSDSRLRIIHQDNSGFVSAIKTAISLARGEYIAMQGAGDISLPERLHFQSKLLDSNETLGAVGCKIINVIKGGVNDGHITHPAYKNLNPKLQDFLHGGNPFSHGEVMFRKSAYELVGGYRDFFKFAQDRDLWIRIAKHFDFEIHEKLLYERRNFTSDGISTDRKKLILQQTLSHFARQCHHDREKYGKDYIDLYGMHAGLFREKSKELAKKISKHAIQSLVKNENASANFYASLATSEKLTIFSGLTFIAVYLCSKSKATHSATKYLILKMVKNSELWNAKN